MKSIFTLLLFPVIAFGQTFKEAEIKAWKLQAQNATVHVDQWGVPHIYGKSDADAVFALMYEQCRQNFSRVERNYLEMMGRLSEVEGNRYLYEDLQMRLIYDSAAAKKDYTTAPLWLKKLLDAFAGGINFYLHGHPETKPLLIKRFEPWFPLMYTDGSIAPTQTGGVTLTDLKNFYEDKSEPTSLYNSSLSIADFTQSGSNGFAIGPSKTASGNAILYINPHVTFYFRTEVHLVSEEGLNAYGAVTWGQFFIYQGFNEYCGWMHTSSYADVADVYEISVEKEEANYWYLTGDARRAAQKKDIVIRYKDGNTTKEKTYPAYSTIHGPVMGKRNNKWLALKENNRSMASLMQSWLRTKAKGFEEYKKIMDMRVNNSNNTVFADNKGNIAYWHGNFMPRRNPKYDWKRPVPGNTPETLWQGMHTLEETVHIYNPKSGWIQNCNSTAFTAAGSSSPKKENYPEYMAPDGQNGRALNAMRLLQGAKMMTPEKTIAIGYNTYMSAFDFLLPALFSAYDSLSATNPLKQDLETPVHYLRSWDKQASASSIATTLAIEWAFKLAPKVPPASTTEEATNAIRNFTLMAALPTADQVKALQETIAELTRLYGTWQMAWGDVNRYQRTSDNVFDDNAPSLPVGLGPGTWGSLPSFASRRANTKKRYGVSGNSFVAAVEFGKRLKAKSIMTGGESFDPASPHYTDQAEGYINGRFKDINFYKADVLKNSRTSYHPGK